VATALQMVMVAGGIANDGVVMRPYLVDHTADAAGGAITTTRPRTLGTATDPATAATVRTLMVGVVDAGSGTRARIPGVRIAGKTGTAEVGKGQVADAWFVAFGPASAGATPRIAVAIILENAGVGGRVAAPAARTVLEAGLKR
jgi:peptidoglycan glycosyltransferase